MYGLAIVAPFLLIPPVGVGITELAGNCRRVDIAAVHIGVLDVGLGEVADLWAVGEGGYGGAEDLDQRSRNCEASSEHLHSINTLDPRRSEKL